MAELYLLSGDGQEQVVPLHGDPVSFGRDTSCDVVLTEEMASRQHCTVRPNRGGWRVVDDQSSNGTWLGGRPVLSARLQPGDEIEIGHTVIVYSGDAEAAAMSPRPKRRKTKQVSWGLLVVPVVLLAASYLGVGAYAAGERESQNRSWTATARATIERADLADDAKARRAILDETLRALPDNAATAQRLLRAAKLAEPDRNDADDDSWRGDLAQLEGGWQGLSMAQRRGRLADLLDRHFEEPDASAIITRLLLRLAGDRSREADDDRERTLREADTATEQGRLGEALDLLNGWLLRTPSLTPDDERTVAERLHTITDRAEDAARSALQGAEKLAGDGKKDAAGPHLESAVTRLRGTGWDAWLSARAVRYGDVPGLASVDLGGKGDAATGARERTIALRALAAAEEMTRLRRFDDAATKLDQALTKLEDATLRNDLQDRLADVRAEAAVLRTVLGQVKSVPNRFSPLKIDGVAWRVNGATDDGLLLSRKDDSVVRTVAQLPGDALTFLCRKASLQQSDLVPAALLAWDMGDQPTYTHFMRSALGVEDDETRTSISTVHARLHGRSLPAGGYVPHPEIDDRIITWDEWKAIQNAEKIGEYTAQLAKLVERIEDSKAAKQIAKVRKAYRRLEDARDFALELIFDTEKYFYPYQDRMREYAPVEKEVSGRVSKVREAWASNVRAKPKNDRGMSDWIDKAEDLQVEIDYLGGDSMPFMDRIEAITRYLDRDLNVQNWFESRADLQMLEYNDRVMESNLTAAPKALKTEREQVRITNAYRIMFGHRTAVKINAELTMSARGHSQDMARLGFFAHDSPVPGKHKLQDRVRLANYPMMGTGENIHRGSGSPQGAHNGWEHSSGHHRNLLDKPWREMGTGHSGRHWTQNFGFRATDPF